MSELSLNYLDSTINAVVSNLTLRTAGADRLTISSAGAVAVAGGYSTKDISAISYNGYTPVNKAGDTMTGTLSAPTFQIGGSTAYHPGNYNSVINRGNPGAGSTLLLARFDEVHVYSADAVNSIELSTTMIENSIYSVHYTTTSSNPNADPYIAPNFTSYASQFNQFYYGSPQDTAGNPNIFNQPGQPYFYFDHYAGGVGTEPTGTFILFNFRQKKHAIYHGGDTQSHAYGTGRWDNSSTVWTNVGTLGGITGMNVRVHVRRIG